MHAVFVTQFVTKPPLDQPPTLNNPDRTMNCVAAANNGVEACANCGKHGSDIVKLKNCNACRLVKYCGVDCQKTHRKKHKGACKKRATELKGEQLYSQGHERPDGDFCPICTLPIQLPMGRHSLFAACCMKRICDGCNMAAQNRGMHDCPFCRTPFPENEAAMLAMAQARVEKKDPAAIQFLGSKYCYGQLGLQKDARKAVQLFKEAAELGSIDALYHLGYAHYHGEGVQEDKVKGVHFYEKAAMQGDFESRYNLGCFEAEKGNCDRAIRHWLIAAKMGTKVSVDQIKKMFTAGLATSQRRSSTPRRSKDIKTPWMKRRAMTGIKPREILESKAVI